MLKRVLFAAAIALASPSAQADTPPPQGHPLTASDLDAFFDGFMPLALERGNIAGSVVAVVKDGQVVFERGYGVSDEKTQAPIDPYTTMFRPGSVSKLFTWTAVMQLAELHKVDLDTDINNYLDFRIPPRDGKPITLRTARRSAGLFELWRGGCRLHRPAGFR
jgi:CubicO group peptidase (beta-lactamase class C family)